MAATSGESSRPNPLDPHGVAGLGGISVVVEGLVAAGGIGRRA
jgi:hypothetical protein